MKFGERILIRLNPGQLEQVKVATWRDGMLSAGKWIRLAITRQLQVRTRHLNDLDGGE